MNDPAQERIDEYLDMVDAAENDDWFPGTYDEWKVVKARMGITIPRGLDAYCMYSEERLRAAERTCGDAMLYFSRLND